MNASILLILLTILGDDPLPVAPPPAPEGPCRLIVDGEGIEKLVLHQVIGKLSSQQGSSEGIRPYLIDVTTPNISLAPGQYRVAQVILKSGCSYDTKMEWFTLTADKPYRFRAGEPVTPHVEATRRGRLLKLDYRLTDAGGWPCADTDQSTSRSPPHFTIYQGGDEIASGSFEYG